MKNSVSRANIESHEGGNNSTNLRRNSFRHTSQQIERLEQSFKTCAHPSEEKRLELSIELDLTLEQVRFWFQNRRVQANAKNQRMYADALRDENENLAVENFKMHEVISRSQCPTCDISGMRDERLHNLRMENQHLKQQQDIWSKNLGNIVRGTELFPAIRSLVLSLEEGSLGNRRDEQSTIVEIARRAMEDWILLLRYEDRAWIKSPPNGRDIIDQNFYMNHVDLCSPIKSMNSWRESSKYSGLVEMGAQQLLEVFMDPKKWMELVPTVVEDARTIEMIDATVIGNRAESMQLMYEKVHAISPVVAPRVFYVVRYSKQLEPGFYIVVDVSYDSPRWKYEPTEYKCWRKPSGCMIKARPDGCSEVTWFEHVEVNDKAAAYSPYQLSDQNSSAYGAHCWVLNLQRMVERLACSTATSSHVGGLPPQGRGFLMKTTNEMIRSFLKDQSKCQNTLIGMQNGNIQVSFRPSAGTGGTIVSASSSLWLGTSRQPILDYLNDETSRAEWDNLTAASADVAKIEEVSYGSYPGNQVFAFKTSSNWCIIQESCNDPLVSLLAYARVPAQWIKSLRTGNVYNVPILPMGFIITEDGPVDHLDGTASTSSGGGMRGGSTLTLLYQMLVDPITTPEANMKAVADINKIISKMLLDIRCSLCARAIVM